MSLKVFFSSVSSSTEMREKPLKIFRILDSKKIEYEAVDISQNPQDRDLMRQLAGDQRALPPQICKGNDYCGDYNAFLGAIEGDTLKNFLKL